MFSFLHTHKHKLVALAVLPAATIFFLVPANTSAQVDPAPTEDLPTTDLDTNIKNTSVQDPFSEGSSAGAAGSIATGAIEGALTLSECEGGKVETTDILKGAAQGALNAGISYFGQEGNGGDIVSAAASGAAQGGGSIGSASGIGSTVGGVAGGIAGSLIPGAGTAVGGAVGSSLGGLVGGMLGGGGGSKGPERMVENSLRKKERCLDGLAGMASNELISNLSDSATTWVKNGFEVFGEKGNPAIVQNVGQHLTSLAYNEVNNYLRNSENFQDVCSIYQNEVLRSLQSDFRANPESFGTSSQALVSSLPEVDPGNCDLESTVSATSAQEFVSGDFSEGGWESWDELTSNFSNTPVGAFLEKSREYKTKVEKSQQSRRDEINRSEGFLSARNDQGAVVTPGSVVSNIFNTLSTSDVRRAELADEVDEAVNSFGSTVIANIMGAGTNAQGDPSGGFDEEAGVVGNENLGGDIEQRVRSNFVSRLEEQLRVERSVLTGFKQAQILVDPDGAERIGVVNTSDQEQELQKAKDTEVMLSGLNRCVAEGNAPASADNRLTVINKTKLAISDSLRNRKKISWNGDPLAWVPMIAEERPQPIGWNGQDYDWLSDGKGHEWIDDYPTGVGNSDNVETGNGIKGGERSAAQWNRRHSWAIPDDKPLQEHINKLETGYAPYKTPGWQTDMDNCRGNTTGNQVWVTGPIQVERLAPYDWGQNIDLLDPNQNGGVGNTSLSQMHAEWDRGWGAIIGGYILGPRGLLIGDAVQEVYEDKAKDAEGPLEACLIAGEQTDWANYQLLSSACVWNPEQILRVKDRHSIMGGIFEATPIIFAAKRNNAFVPHMQAWVQAKCEDHDVNVNDSDKNWKRNTYGDEPGDCNGYTIGDMCIAPAWRLPQVESGTTYMQKGDAIVESSCSSSQDVGTHYFVRSGEDFWRQIQCVRRRSPQGPPVRWERGAFDSPSIDLVEASATTSQPIYRTSTSTYTTGRIETQREIVSNLCGFADKLNITSGESKYIKKNCNYSIPENPTSTPSAGTVQNDFFKLREDFTLSSEDTVETIQERLEFYTSEAKGLNRIARKNSCKGKESIFRLGSNFGYETTATSTDDEGGPDDDIFTINNFAASRPDRSSETININWNALGANRCNAESTPELSGWSGSVSINGSQTVQNEGDTTLKLTCESDQNTDSIGGLIPRVTPDGDGDDVDDGVGDGDGDGDDSDDGGDDSGDGFERR